VQAPPQLDPRLSRAAEMGRIAARLPGPRAAGLAARLLAGSSQGGNAWVQCTCTARAASSAAEPLAAASAGRWPVVIVGAGPTGLTLSLLLSRLGVRSLLLERAGGPTEHPQVPQPQTARALPGAESAVQRALSAGFGVTWSASGRAPAALGALCGLPMRWVAACPAVSLHARCGRCRRSLLAALNVRARNGRRTS